MSMGLPSARSNAFCTKPDNDPRLSATNMRIALSAATSSSRRMGQRKPLPAAGTADFDPVLLNFGHAGRPPISQRPSGSAALRARAGIVNLADPGRLFAAPLG